jgi:hypothetical protein
MDRTWLLAWPIPVSLIGMGLSVTALICSMAGTKTAANVS